MQKRITLDWDSKKFESVSIRKSTNGGLHIVLWLREEITNKKHFKLRFKYGDDINRIRLDKKRLKRGEPINILFSNTKIFRYKNGRNNRKRFNR